MPISTEQPLERRPTEAGACDRGCRIGLVLTGGGARAAYQVGLVRHLAKRLPEFHFDVLTGVSAGAINASFLASHQGSAAEATEELSRIWLELTPDHVFRDDGWSLGGMVVRWLLNLASGGMRYRPQVRGLVDTSPLGGHLGEVLGADSGNGRVLPGIAKNLDRRRLDAVAVTTVEWSTGQTVTWVQGRDIETWERPKRRSERALLTLDHVLASASLPLIFPAVRIGGAWHGDGGVRLTSPLSPALHLGCDRLIAVSTRHEPLAPRAAAAAYPPPAQFAGVLLNAVFLDQLDQDANRMELVNGLLARMPESPDLLSLLMFQPDYIRALIEVGERDAEARHAEIADLLEGSPTRS